MRKIVLSALVLLFTIHASYGETISSFDSLSLSKADTFYVNFSTPGKNVGFTNGLRKIPCVYDTSFGFSYWSSGFSYSNKTDSVTAGFGNQYSAITAKGYGGSAKYAVAYGSVNYVTLLSPAKNFPLKGFYVTNSTYAYRSMKTGDAFAKKFGGATGNDPDWFKLQVCGYLNGSIKTDTVNFYLADYRSATAAGDSIVRGWNWVNLLPLGTVDSLTFHLSSSDTGSFGMNTPAYFCIDNFTTGEPSIGVKEVAQLTAKVYPNPATEHLYIDNGGAAIKTITVIDAAGRVAISQKAENNITEVNTANLVPGWYILRLEGVDAVATVRFQKL